MPSGAVNGIGAAVDTASTRRRGAGGATTGGATVTTLTNVDASCGAGSSSVASTVVNSNAHAAHMCATIETMSVQVRISLRAGTESVERTRPAKRPRARGLSTASTPLRRCGSVNDRDQSHIAAVCGQTLSDQMERVGDSQRITSVVERPRRLWDSADAAETTTRVA